MKISTKSLTIMVLSITIVGTAVYNVLLAPQGGGGMGGAGRGMGAGGAGMARGGMPRSGMTTMPRTTAMAPRTTVAGVSPQTASVGTRTTFAQGVGARRFDGRQMQTTAGTRFDGRRFDSRFDGRRFDGRRFDGRGDWRWRSGWGWRRPFFGPSFSFGFFAGAPWWWGSYAYPWYSPYWGTIDLQQQIYYLQQQVAYLIQQLNYITDAQQQQYLQEQIDQYNQQLAILTGQPYGY